MKIKVFTLNAFAKNKKGGNPAGVVLESGNLSDKKRLLIAKKVGFSETAFIEKSNKASYKVRFFTPKKEVALCGHATIATFYVLFKNKMIKSGCYTQETKAGTLQIMIDKSGVVYMEQNVPRFFKIINKTEIAEALGITTADINSELPIQIVSTGGMDMYVPVNNLKKLLQIKPNFKKLITISRKYGLEGFCVFTLESKFKATAYYRSFAPAVGILEDPACGVQAGALGSYLCKYQAVLKEKNNEMIFEQGYTMNKPSEIKVKLMAVKNNITKVMVGGKALNIKTIKLEI